MGNIFWDLDGTLVDPRKRLYQLFCELTKCHMDFDMYWQYKAQGYTQRQMLEKVIHYPETEIEAFSQLWLKKIEEPDRLELDMLYEEVLPVFQKLSEYDFKQYIVTNRQSYDNTIEELENLGIIKYINKVLTTGQKSTKDEIVKRSVIYSPKDYFIGDSGEDIKAAKALGVISIGINLRGNSELLRYCPDYCVDNHNGVLQIIEKNIGKENENRSC